MHTAPPEATLNSYPLDDRFRPRPHVVWTTHADVTVLLDADRGMYYTLNDVAGRTWELLAAREPVIEILQCLAEEYEVKWDVLEGDLGMLLTHLQDAVLIERLSP